MSKRGLAGGRTEYLEIGEYNFAWPSDNGTFHDFGSVNYTMPSGTYDICFCFLVVPMKYNFIRLN